MIGSYRIHNEQIKKVEQSLKAPYLRHRVGPCIHEDSGIVMMQIKRPENIAPIQRQKSCDYDRDLRQDPPTLPPSPGSATRCFRCNTRIHEMDYLYTKKTGLCIPCWEEQVT